jgi:hypothetical protein
MLRVVTDTPAASPAPSSLPGEALSSLGIPTILRALKMLRGIDKFSYRDATLEDLPDSIEQGYHLLKIQSLLGLPYLAGLQTSV